MYYLSFPFEVAAVFIAKCPHLLVCKFRLEMCSSVLSQNGSPKGSFLSLLWFQKPFVPVDNKSTFADLRFSPTPFQSKTTSSLHSFSPIAHSFWYYLPLPPFFASCSLFLAVESAGESLVLLSCTSRQRLAPQVSAIIFLLFSCNTTKVAFTKYFMTHQHSASDAIA